MKKIFFAIFLIVTTMWVSGCGYSTRSALPPSWRTIYVPPFENKIDFTAERQRNLYQPLLEVKVRDAVINRFLFDGSLKIAQEDQAALVLKGELVGYDRGPLRWDDSNDVQEYRIQISVNLRLTEVKDGELVFEEKGFSGEDTYFVSGPKATSEDAALQGALEDLARRVVERTIENW